MGHHHRRPSKRRRVSFRTPDEASTVLPLQIAMNRAALLLPHEQEEVFKPTREAFEQFRLGHGNEARCAQLVDAMKISAELACRQIASDHKRTFAEALEVLADVINRHARTGSWTLKGTEIGSLELAVLVHHIQLQKCSRGELSTSVSRVIEQVRQALAGNVAPGVQVYPVGLLGGASAAAVAASAAQAQA